MPNYCGIELNNYEALFLSQIWGAMQEVRSSPHPFAGVTLHDIAVRFNYDHAEIHGLYWALRHKCPPLIGANFAPGMSISFTWKDQTLNLNDKGLEIIESGSLPDPNSKIILNALSRKFACYKAEDGTVVRENPRAIGTVSIHNPVEAGSDLIT